MSECQARIRLRVPPWLVVWGWVSAFALLSIQVTVALIDNGHPWVGWWWATCTGFVLLRCRNLSRGKRRVTMTPVWTAHGVYEADFGLEPQGGYSASVPVMPEIRVSADRYEDARMRLGEAIDAWLLTASATGQPIPAPIPVLTAEEYFSRNDEQRGDTVLAGLGDQTYCVRSGLPNGHTYPVVVSSSVDFQLVAEVPNLPGCRAQASSFAGTMLALEQAVGAWIVEAVRAGTPIPGVDPLPVMPPQQPGHVRAPHPLARVVQVCPVAGKLRILLSDGSVLVTPVDPWPRLRTATGSSLMDFQVSGGGLAMVWSDLDTIIWLDDLVG